MHVRRREWFKAREATPLVVSQIPRSVFSQYRFLSYLFYFFALLAPFELFSLQKSNRLSSRVRVYISPQIFYPAKMDRRRGERSGNNPEIHHNRYSGRMGSRSYDNHHRSPNNCRGGFSGGDHHQRHHPFDSPPRNHPIGGGGFRPMGGGGIGDGGGYSMPLSGQKRGFSFSGRGGSSPDDTDGVSFAKLFVGSVPRTATEEEIRPLFEEHGDVIEVALIKDKRTGQQQGCCFIKYATSEEADRAIRALHNQYTLPGGVGPIQVRYADGERERLGNCLSAVEYKLFVGSLNRQATEKEVEEIFSPYGRVEDVYIMRDELKQSRGRGFVKFSHRDMAAAAINALNGTYVMRGCEQPLIVRFADPKRPRGGESRGPSFGGPGFGPRSQAPPGIRRTPNLGDPMGGQIPPNAWHPMSPQSVGSSSQATAHGFGSHFPDRGGVASVPSTMGGPSGVLGGPTNGSHPSLAALPSSNFQQGSNPSLSQIPSVGQQTSPLQKPLQSPQNLLPPMQLHPQQTPGSYPQVQTSQASIQQLDQQQIPSSASQSSFHQAFPSHQLYGSSGQVSISQPQVHQNVSSSASQLIPLNLQRQGVSGPASQQQMSVPSMQQQMLQPPQQSPNQLAQVLSQQTQALQASFQSSQQAFSQLQQQLHHIQQSNQNPTQQHSSQANKNQSSWTGMIPQTVASTSATAPAVVAPSATSGAPTAPVSAQVAVPVTCDWTEHTSPEGYKYYYNSVTKESRWEKPEELTLFEQQLQQKQQQQHQQQKPLVQLQPPSQTHPQVLSTPQISQTQQIQLQTQQHNQPHLQFQHPLSSSYQASGVIAHQNAPGFQAAQEWMWKNKPAGS